MKTVEEQTQPHFNKIALIAVSAGTKNIHSQVVVNGIKPKRKFIVEAILVVHEVK